MPVRLKRIFLILLLIGILFSALTYILGDWRISYDDVQISKLLVCLEPDKIAEKMDDSHQVVSSDSKYIFACGQLITNSPVRLHFYLYKKPDSRLIDNSSPGKEFSEGFFNQQLYLPNFNRVGNYQIDVYLFRNIIASTTFDVIDP